MRVFDAPGGRGAGSGTVRQILGRAGEVRFPSSGADRLFVVRT
jgi:hypothetical protein